MAPADSTASGHFIKQIVVADNESGKYDGRVHTRFPPEPNGYLHIGHAKSIWINFGLAEEFGGLCNLRFDDTNPSKESVEFVEAIKRDIRWLGYDWDDRLYFASDYFEQLYQYAVALIEKGSAYVCDLTPEQVREYRGTLTEPGKESPFRNRPIDENLDLFRRMRAGEFEDGSRTLRAKIDMASPNINLRDPVLYRIQSTHHHRTGDAWCIYPMYDMAHGYSDSIEGITHSICTLEFENHRPLYDWLIEQLDLYHPQQIEFNRLNLTYTVMSKRKLRKLVEEGHVAGWDDPRMPTLSGMRRRGYTPQAIRNLCQAVGVSKSNSTTEFSLVDHHLRQDLNRRAERRFGVVRPLKLILTNYPEDETEMLVADNHPGDESAGTREVPFSRELWIERADFMEDPPKKFFRLSPGEEVRLRYAYIIKCHHVVKEDGEVVEIHCTYDPDSKSGSGTEASRRKVKGTLHWVSAKHAVEAELRLYSHLFLREDPYELDDEDGDFTDNLNPDSLEVVTDARLELSLAELEVGDTVQFERKGYFSVDPDSKPEALVFNRTITLRDTWKKIQKQERHRQHQKRRRKR